MPERPSIVVVGSVNLDIVARAERLPVAGETITGAELSRFPGGKGANQALAARRLGADVSLIGCVGDDAEAGAALALLREGGVELSGCIVDKTASTGVALIAVAATGENQIVVAPGANRELTAAKVDLPAADALICQLEVPVPTLTDVIASFNGTVCINLAPAEDVPDDLLRRADVLIVNETEAEYYGDRLHRLGGLVVETFGAAGAAIFRDGGKVAAAGSPEVDAVDTTGAGDCFTAALIVAMAEGVALQDALEFACAAGAAAATKPGAQPSLPDREDVDALLRASKKMPGI
jgi:ribokinase